MTGAETDIAEAWLYGVLAGDAGIQSLVGRKVFGRKAPQTVDFPYISFQLQAPEADTRPMGGPGVMATLHYLVRAIDVGESFLGLVPIAARIYALIDSKGGPAAGGQVFDCYRTMPYQDANDAEGKSYVYLGGLYRLQVG